MQTTCARTYVRYVENIHTCAHPPLGGCAHVCMFGMLQNKDVYLQVLAPNPTAPSVT